MKSAFRSSAVLYCLALTLLPLTASAKFLSVDPKANKYPDISPYAYSHNNPVNRVDPNGESDYLLAWAPRKSEFGHAAIAVDLYDKEGKPTGQVQVRELWPGGQGMDKNHLSAPADYISTTIKASDLGGFQSLEGRPPDGIVKIAGGASDDQKVQSALNSAEQNKTYQAVSNNCTDYAAKGLRAVGVPTGPGGNAVVALGKFFFGISNVLTPVSVYNAVTGSNDPRVTVVKPLPTDQTDPNMGVKH